MTYWKTLLQDASHWSFLFGALTSAAGFVAQRIISRYLAHRKIRQLDFLDRINVSLNLFIDSKLKVRTLFERPLDEIVHNPHVRGELQKAAYEASISEDPVVYLPEAYSWFVHNCILNAIAEQFCLGPFREQQRLPVDKATYVFWVTCEPSVERRERKIRVFMMEEGLLHNFPFLEEMPALESPRHADRVHSLRRSCEVLQKTPSLYSRVEIAL
jgi:hypothetical protein